MSQDQRPASIRPRLVSYATGGKGSTEVWHDPSRARFIVFCFQRRAFACDIFRVDADAGNWRTVSDLFCGWGELPVTAARVSGFYLDTLQHEETKTL